MVENLKKYNGWKCKKKKKKKKKIKNVERLKKNKNKGRLKKEWRNNKEIIFKWDRKMIESLLKSVFQKVGR